MNSSWVILAQVQDPTPNENYVELVEVTLQRHLALQQIIFYNRSCS